MFEIEKLNAILSKTFAHLKYFHKLFYIALKI